MSNNSNASNSMLYSGGHKGAEVCFGECAEKYGMNEITYNFEGHEIDREKNVKILSEEELNHGMVSMDIVAKHMERTYGHTENIRKIMQTIFAMINDGYQVFAVGWILSNKTIKGGTGWGVELAKFFNRPVHVFDQDKNEWFTWKENNWVPDEPIITHRTLAATGTRQITEAGCAAIEDLFKRSFR